MYQACVACTTAYAVGIPGCPHCGTREYRLSSEPDGQVYVLGPDGTDVPVNEPGPAPEAPKGAKPGGGDA